MITVYSDFQLHTSPPPNRTTAKMMEIASTAAAAIHGLFQPTHPLKAQWERIDSIPLPRSSHTISVVAGRAYIFGGEITPREPVDNSMHVISLPTSTASSDYREIPAVAEATSPGGEVPEKRVGHTAAVIGERIFVWGGRGGKDMKPLEEKGRVWIYNTRSDKWTFLDPVEGTPYPAARSYHSSVAVEKPEARNTNKAGGIKDVARDLPEAGDTAVNAKEEGEKGYGTLFIHAGCPPTGRTNDLWGFDVRSRTWKEYPSGPGKPRGGTSLCVSKNRIFRFGGFNGDTEEGGQVDYLELAVDTLSDLSGEGLGELTLTSKSSWDTLRFDGGGDADINDQGRPGGNRAWPGDRSVAGFQCITTGMGREYLVLMLGERDPAAKELGHNGAGKFWGDVWTLQVMPQGKSAAALKDATWQAAGRETGEGLWSQVYVADAEGVEGDDVKKLVPGERGCE